MYSHPLEEQLYYTIEQIELAYTEGLITKTKMEQLKQEITE